MGRAYVSKLDLGYQNGNTSNLLKNFVALPYFVTHEAKESQNLKSENDLEITLSVLLF